MPSLIFEAWGLTKTFKGGRAGFGGGGVRVRALRGVSLSLAPGESLGLVGESGGGKSTLLKVLLGLEAPDSGILSRPEKRIGLLLQDPAGSLDPVWPVWRLVTEALPALGLKSRSGRRAKAGELLASVGLSPGDLDLHADRFSGGQRQRLGLARALSTEPRALFLDEPVSSLDVTVQSQILELLVRLREVKSLAYFVISHDLDAVAELCDRMAVLYQGRVVETGPTEKILKEAAHPYTRGLIQSRPLSPTQEDLPKSDPGPIPPQGCGYAPRCPRARDLCARLDPPLFTLGPGRGSACLFPVEGFKN